MKKLGHYLGMVETTNFWILRQWFDLFVLYKKCEWKNDFIKLLVVGVICSAQNDLFEEILKSLASL